MDDSTSHGLWASCGAIRLRREHALLVEPCVSLRADTCCHSVVWQKKERGGGQRPSEWGCACELFLHLDCDPDLEAVIVTLHTGERPFSCQALVCCWLQPSNRSEASKVEEARAHLKSYGSQILMLGAPLILYVGILYMPFFAPTSCKNLACTFDTLDPFPHAHPSTFERTFWVASSSCRIWTRWNCLANQTYSDAGCIHHVITWCPGAFKTSTFGINDVIIPTPICSSNAQRVTDAGCPSFWCRLIWAAASPGTSAVLAESLSISRARTWDLTWRKAYLLISDVASAAMVLGSRPGPGPRVVHPSLTGIARMPRRVLCHRNQMTMTRYIVSWFFARLCCGWNDMRSSHAVGQCWSVLDLGQIIVHGLVVLSEPIDPCDSDRKSPICSDVP